MDNNLNNCSSSNDSNDLNPYNVQHIMVNKNKLSEFIDAIHKNEILKDCNIFRMFKSGNYYILTFEISLPKQRTELKNIQDDWI